MTNTCVKNIMKNIWRNKKNVIVIKIHILPTWQININFDKNPQNGYKLQPEILRAQLKDTIHKKKTYKNKLKSKKCPHQSPLFHIHTHQISTIHHTRLTTTESAILPFVLHLKIVTDFHQNGNFNKAFFYTREGQL